jgi:PTH2 family peptidyl-tRNA hydrolase
VWNVRDPLTSLLTLDPMTMHTCALCGPVSDDPSVQYFVVNADLNMSPGKIAAQVAHGATLTMLAMLDTPDAPAGPPVGAHLAPWLASGMRKVVLRGRERDLLALEAQGGTAVRDHGHTEVPPNSLTVVALAPMPKSVARPLVKRLQAL